ncbi:MULTISPECIES: tryptophan synthase subunit alpha [unclassified Streptomyces]|uniref:tryptophan synthase subunit alpha n=1 Tax=Streptomycetaceae TaxID=2062 RepID=UPI002E77F2A8|nr:MULTISPECIES: tryptophan synthase subunit alpha [unclassified Streptomyces]MED7948967.1 tryptophan synthase subunit alpha [Streptomyces sp. BE303]MEE1825272.1 tryptophan synthase subunit alpha [Streptomyces sp. BE20]
MSDPTEHDGRPAGGFFAGRSSADPGLALFLNAGDPGLDRLADLVRLLDEERVDCLELAVPFPDSVTDGPVIRRSARRALEQGVDLDAVLGFVERVRPELRHTRIALLADWGHSVKPVGLEEFLRRARDAGADATLLHGLPPLARRRYLEAAERIGQPVVTTCYPNSPREVLAESAEFASAYLYLVAHFGRSGTAPAPDRSALAPVVATLKGLTPAPVAVGFGVRTAEDVSAMGDLGADAAIVGSALVAEVERVLETGGDLLAELAGFIGGLRHRPVHEEQLSNH